MVVETATYDGAARSRRVLGLSTVLHFLGFSPYVVLPSLSPLGGASAFPIFLALVGVTAGSGLSSLAIGRALDRRGGVPVAAAGMVILSVGYLALALVAASPLAWLAAGLVLGVGVQATGGQTAFHILQTARPDDAAKSHFIANLGVSASGLLLPWLVAAIGAANGWRGVNLSLAGGLAAATVIAWFCRPAAQPANSNASASDPLAALTPRAILRAFLIPRRLLMIAAGFGLMASGGLVFSTLMARSMGSNLTFSSALVASIAAGAATGRVGFAVALARPSARNLVNIIGLVCAACQILACAAVAVPGHGALVLCAIAFVYGVGTAGNMALLPVFVHRNAKAAAGGAALGQVRFAMTPFQMAAILLVGASAVRAHVAASTFLFLAAVLLLATLTIAAASRPTATSQ